MTLLELIIACGILLILATVALPLERVTLERHREPNCVMTCGRCATRSTAIRTLRTRI